MRSLGIRVEPSAVHWAIADGSSTVPILVAIDTAEAPTAYEEGLALSWFRDRIGFVIDQYIPEIMAIRFSEPIGKSRGSDAAHQRSRLEGVLLEFGNSRNLKIVAGALVTITKNLGSGSAKKYLDQQDLRGLDWSKYSKNKREAILAAVSVLPAR